MMMMIIIMVMMTMMMEAQNPQKNDETASGRILLCVGLLEGSYSASLPSLAGSQETLLFWSHDAALEASVSVRHTLHILRQGPGLI